MTAFEHNGTTYDLPSRDGMTFRSVAAALRIHVRDEKPIYDHGIEIGQEKELVADFADQSQAGFFWTEGDGADNEWHINIRGHFCNTKLQAEQKGWSDDERELVEKKLIVTCRADSHWLYSKTPATPPWPSYDTTHHLQIAKLAEATGTAAEALHYEAENKKREGVMAQLREIREKVSVSAEAIEEIAAL